jgi:putative FmdB family regulatory protein
MPMYRFSCNKCGKDFDKILPTSDISSVTCSRCESGEIKRIITSSSDNLSNRPTHVPAGALSGGSCKTGFS